MNDAQSPGIAFRGAVARPGARAGRTILALAFLGIAAVGGCLLWRWTSIGQIPVIADPFDRLKDGIVSIRTMRMPSPSTAGPTPRTRRHQLPGSCWDTRAIGRRSMIATYASSSFSERP